MTAPITPCGLNNVRAKSIADLSGPAFGVVPAVSATPTYGGPLEIQDPRLIAETYRFRAEVWRKEGLSVDARPDKHALHARHWIVTRNGIIVGAARMTTHESIESTPSYEDIRHLPIAVDQPFAFLSHLVVCPSARSRGLGKLLDSVRVCAACSAGMKRILGRFYEYRVKGLEALGFRPVAEFHNSHMGSRRVVIMEMRLA